VINRVYVAGPMTGHPNYNFPAFAEATARLRFQGFNVISPAEHDEAMGWVVVERDPWGGILSATKREEGAFDWATALAWDLEAIDRCDCIYLLPGWSKSRGATKEYEHAHRTGKVLLGAVAEAADRVMAHQPLVGLVGYAQSGKDTFATALGYRRIAFADPLKRLAVACNPGLADVETCKLASRVEEMGWEQVKRLYPDAREFLQDLGVGVRDILGADTWVRAAFAQYDPTQATVITDCRFPNELRAIKDRGGVIVRIERPGVGPVNAHVSEHAWGSVAPDYVIENGGDLEHLRRQAEELDRALRGV